MEYFLIFSLILTAHRISSINSEEQLSDVELMALYEKRVDMEEFVYNIFDLPAPEQLYAYEYLQDLIGNLKEDPKTATFFTSALNLLQKKTDDFNGQHNLEIVPVKKFLQKRITVMQRTDSKKSEENPPNESLTSSATKTTTGSKSNLKDSKISPLKSETSKNLNMPKKISPKPELEPKPEPANPIIKPMLLAKESNTSSATPINTIKLPSSPNSKENKQKIQTNSPSSSDIPPKLEKFESSTSKESLPESEPTEKPSPVLKETPLSSGATSKRKKTPPKSKIEPRKKQSSLATEGTTSKAIQLNSEEPSQNMKASLPSLVNQLQSNPLQKDIEGAKPDGNEISKMKSRTATLQQKQKKSKEKLVQNNNSDRSDWNPRRPRESVADLSFSV